MSVWDMELVLNKLTYTEHLDIIMNSVTSGNNFIITEGESLLTRRIVKLISYWDSYKPSRYFVEYIPTQSTPIVQRNNIIGTNSWFNLISITYTYKNEVVTVNLDINDNDPYLTALEDRCGRMIR